MTDYLTDIQYASNVLLELCFAASKSHPVLSAYPHTGFNKPNNDVTKSNTNCFLR